MKFLIDAHVFDDLSQGSKTYLKGLYYSVLRLNTKDEYYFATNALSSFRSELKDYSNASHLQYSSHNKFIRLGWDIPKLVRRNKIEWAHFQYISPIRKTCSELVTIHDLLFLDYPDFFPRDYRVIKNFLFKRSAKRAEWVLTVSEFSRQALVKYYNLNPEKVIITPNGILDCFWETSETKTAVGSRCGVNQFILYVSRFEPRKNQAGLLKSYLDLQLWRQGVQLVYVGGKGIKTPEFDQRYEPLDDNVKRMIFFFEDLSLTDLKWLYKNCLLFVYPSFAEGFGIPPLEAIASGANVICSGTTAMSEFRFLGERLFDPANRDEMTQKIDFYLKNTDHHASVAIQNYVRTHYSWDVAANQFLSLFT